MTGYLLVGAGAAVGAPLRYLVDRFVQTRHRSKLPFGTFTANAVGCLILGLLTGFSLAGSSPLQLLIGTGFCGALTTYSTFSYETWWLINERARVLAAVNLIGSIAIGLGAVSLGYLITGGGR